MGNNASAYADAQGWYDRQANAGLMGRNLALQDLGLNFDLAQGMNQEELIGPGLSLDQFNAGLNYQNMQAGAQDRAAGYGTGMGQQDYANWVAANNIARGYGNDAFQQNMTNLGVQSANAGWGRNMIAGAAGGLANAFVPGSGQFVSSAISGGGQASPYNFGQFNYGPTAQQQAVMNLPAPPSWMYPQYSTPGSLPPYRP